MLCMAYGTQCKAKNNDIIFAVPILTLHEDLLKDQNAMSADNVAI